MDFILSFVCLTKPVMGEALHVQVFHGVLDRPKKDQAPVVLVCHRVL